MVGLDPTFLRVETVIATVSIAIGVFLVATTLQLVRGFDLSLRTQIENIGSETVFVTKFEQGIRLGRRSAEERRRPDLTVETARSLRARARSLEAVSPETSLWTAARWQGRELERTLLVGGTEDYLVAHHATPDHGRGLTTGEVRSGRRVCVVGEGVARGLFGSPADAVGQTIEVVGARFEILGVAPPRGSPLFGRAVDHFILIPERVFESLGIPRRFTEFVIAVSPRPGVALGRSVAEVRRILRELRHRRADDPDDFAITPQTGLLAVYRRTFGAVLGGVVALGSVSLLVGAMGILTVMLLTVFDRTREIGVRRAVGARKLDVFSGFLVEGLVIATLGGALGSGVSLLSVAAFSALTGLAVTVSPALLGGSVAGAAGVGLLATCLPAWRAACLDPAEALRDE